MEVKPFRSGTGVKVAVTTLLLLSCRLGTMAQVGSLDSHFDPRNGFNFEETNYSRLQFVRQRDGSILVLGNFTKFNGVTRNHIARLQPAGSLDLSFDPGDGPAFRTYPVVEALAVQPDGRVLIGGTFTNINGVFRQRIARLNPDGSLDTSFNCNPGPHSTVRVIRVCPDGKILIGGYFWTFGSVQRRFIARLQSTGALDLSFDTSQNEITPNCMEVLPNGQVIIAGQPFNYTESSTKRIARLNTNGRPDPTFNPPSGADYHIHAVGLEPDGRIVIGGDFTTVNGVARTNLARLNWDGSNDESFQPRISAPWWKPVTALARTVDGKWFVGGLFTTNDGYPKNFLMRLNPNGELDATFDCGSGPNGWVSSLSLEQDGGLLIGGHFTAINGVSRGRIARLWSNPILGIDLSSSKVPKLVWPSVFSNFVVQSSASVSATEWANIEVSPSLQSNTWTIAVTNFGDMCRRFYRLAKPTASGPAAEN